MHVPATFRATEPPLEADFTHPAWTAATPLVVDRAWSGVPAPAALATTARLLWTRSHLWFGFEGGFTELDVDSAAEVDTAVERVALWERDVCEAFVQAPNEPRDDSYKEFEVAPTGQWCDLAIHRARVDVDWRWNSGMATAATIDHAGRRFAAIMRVPFAAFGVTPASGDRWRVNLFRVGRVDGVRHYLSFSPTGTSTPDFHVSACFVPLEFIGD